MFVVETWQVILNLALKSKLAIDLPQSSGNPLSEKFHEPIAYT